MPRAKTIGELCEEIELLRDYLIRLADEPATKDEIRKEVENITHDARLLVETA